MYQSPFAWYENAVCKGYSSLFYPKDAERPQARDRREQKAKTLCAVCPVLNSCKDYARQNGEFGVWGHLFDSSEQTRRSKFLPPSVFA